MSFVLMMTLFITLIVSAAIIFLYECRIAKLACSHTREVSLYQERLEEIMHRHQAINATLTAFCESFKDDPEQERPEATDD